MSGIRTYYFADNTADNTKYGCSNEDWISEKPEDGSSQKKKKQGNVKHNILSYYLVCSFMFIKKQRAENVTAKYSE